MTIELPDHIKLNVEPVSWTHIDHAENRAYERDMAAGTWTEVEPVWSLNRDKPRILAVTPMHPRYGIKPQTWASIRAALDAYEGPIDWVISRNDNPYMNPYENVTHQHNKARQIVLTGEYDAMLSVEADMIIPPDTINKLIQADADIAYGLYVWRHDKARWSAYKDLNLWGGHSVSFDITGADAREAWGKTIDVAGLGMGCTLIRSSALALMPFRLHDGSHTWIEEEYAADFARMGIDPYQERKGMVCDDYLLALDAQHYGMTQRANLALVCGHIKGDVVLWPDPDADEFVRKEAA
jgi:hypothetical protein